MSNSIFSFKDKGYRWMPSKVVTELFENIPIIPLAVLGHQFMRIGLFITRIIRLWSRTVP